MGYVGNTPALNYTTFAVQHFTTSATTGYTLDNAVTNENGIALFINNVRQEPGSSYAYTASGTTLTLSAATTSSDTMYCVFIGKAVQTVNPPAGSVAASQLATDAVTTVKILDTAVTGAKLNDDSISAQDALGAEPADTDEFLVSDAGTLKRVDYSYIKAITQSNFLPTANPFIINGDMAISQRGTGATTLVHAAYNSVDRWTQNYTAGTSMIFTGQQSTTVPTGEGFASSYKIDCTTAEASLAASSRMFPLMRFEGQDCQFLKFGSTSAVVFTLAFWVRSNLTGTYQINMWNNTNSTLISNTYAISVADTWEKKVLTYSGDQSAALTNDNTATGLQIEFVLAGGTTYTGGTMVPSTTTTWPTYAANTRAANQGVNMASSTANEWYITGLQLESGEYTSADLPPFRHESYGDNLSRCQRYYQLVGTAVGGAANTISAYVIPTFWCPMRATPTAGVEGVLSVNDPAVGNLLQSSANVTLNSGTAEGCFLSIPNLSGITAGDPIISRFLNSNKYQFNAEL